MLPLLTSTVVAVKPRIDATLRWIYQKTFSARDRIAFYDMLAFLLDNNKSLQQAFIDMRHVVTDFGRKHHPCSVLLTDCLSAIDEGQSAFEKVLLEWVPVQEATLMGSGMLSGKLSDALRRASQFNDASKQYIADHRDELLNFPLPYRITPSLLMKNGYLQQGFSEKNGLGQQYVTGVVKNSQKNPPALQALTCSVQGAPLSEKGMRRIATQITGMGGYVDGKNIAIGAYGGWTSDPRDFGLDCRHGHIAMALSSEILGSVLQESDRLYRFQVKHRPELNRMHTHIDMGGNDITHSGRINASGNITTTGTVRGGTVQLDQISISGHRCTPDGLLSRDASGALLSCQSGVWKGAGGGNLSRAGVNALSVESTGDFHFVLVSISSRFFAVDGSHTAMANFTLSLNGRVREQITNRLNVRKTGGGGHYWGYDTVGVVQKQYRLTIAQGDHLRGALSSAHYHLSSDIRIDLSN